MIQTWRRQRPTGCLEAHAKVGKNPGLEGFCQTRACNLIETPRDMRVHESNLRPFDPPFFPFGFGHQIERLELEPEGVDHPLCFDLVGPEGSVLLGFGCDYAESDNPRNWSSAVEHHRVTFCQTAP